MDEQDLLDSVFDQAVRAFTNGTPLPLDELRHDHPGLLPRIDEVVLLARAVALVHGGGLPEVQGYEVLDELGRGGMGQVFLARQKTLGRLVALKVLPPGATASQRSRSRFAAEARALARVRHRNLVAVYDVVASQDCCAYAMEFVQGRSLAQLLAGMRVSGRRDIDGLFAGLGAPSPAVTAPLHVFLCRMAIEVLGALDALHRAGLVHRDVKPSNILVRPEGSAVLADLGLVHDTEAATLTRTGQFVGTPAYAAPEQRRGAPVGQWTDVWALAATLFEALTLTPPGAEPLPLRRIDRDLPQDMETILQKALDPVPARRYASAAAFAEDLERFLSFLPIQARPAPVLDRVGKWVRRQRTVLTASSAGALLVMVLGGMLWAHLARRAELPKRSTEALRRARLVLLWPSHSERIEVEYLVRAQRPDPDERLVAEQSTLSDALREYAEAERLWPLAPADACEYEVLRHVQRRVLGQLPQPASDALHAACPATARAVGRQPSKPPFVETEAAAATRDDRRLLGLYAYLLGLPALCHAAWAPLELDLQQPEPVVDAAAGILHLMLHDGRRALPRLLAGYRAFPEAGFLAVRAADAACLIDDFDAGEHFLAVAAGLGHKDPFDTEQRVRMEILAARGQWDAAEARYRDHVLHHQGIEARRRMVVRCAAAGRWGLALQLTAELLRYPYLPDHGQRLERTLDGWWRSRSFRELVSSVAGESEPRPGVVRQLILRAREESTTPAARSSAGAPHRPDWRDLALTMEALQMDSLMASQVPVWLRRTAAALGLVADSEVGRRVPLVRTAAFLALRSAAAAAVLLPMLARAQPNWSLVATPTAPPARWYAAMEFDEARGELILFGGVGWNGSTRITLGDTWKWTASGGWQLLAPASSPPSRHGAGMVYDASRQVITLFGGFDTATLGDMWDWNGTNWSPTPVTGPAPTARSNPFLAYDRGRGAIVLFGGYDTAHVNDTWEWRLGTWTLVPTAAQPSPRYVGRMVFDEARNRITLFGGVREPVDHGDTWTWDGTTWSMVATTGPAPQHGHAMAWDPDRRVAVLFGGFPILPNVQNWDWNGTTWLRRAPVSTPGNRWGMSMAYDRAGSRAILFGGSNAASGTATPGSTLNDTWAYSSNPPAQFTPFGAGCGSPPPTPGCQHPALDRPDLSPRAEQPTRRQRLAVIRRRLEHGLPRLSAADPGSQPHSELPASGEHRGDGHSHRPRACLGTADSARASARGTSVSPGALHHPDPGSGHVEWWARPARMPVTALCRRSKHDQADAGRFRRSSGSLAKW